MIEVMPFLHLMVSIIEENMPHASDAEILSNIMIVYSLSTLITGVVFLILGFTKLGTLTSFFPRHILHVLYLKQNRMYWRHRILSLSNWNRGLREGKVVLFNRD